MLTLLQLAIANTWQLTLIAGLFLIGAGLYSINAILGRIGAGVLLVLLAVVIRHEDKITPERG
ncbi:hypothetical protein L248_1689 [Schleiferilactobacillus shenzhenensis LY-73]|uniref:Uncharacterized protein n=1 Tax=Schleiferilactobacillus shenzhenensis LY-73 TaxID=1231336 RepID=U4TRA9_9LACO|nr:hypothetical protein L248_1689 [Schleiferilactobacillus shenzhenensis LY-73]